MKTKKTFFTVAISLASVMTFAATQVTNLVTNGDFEDVYSIAGDGAGPFMAVGWDVEKSDDSPANTVSVGNNGYKKGPALKLNVSQKKYFCSSSQVIALEANTAYTFIGYAFYSAAPTNGQLSQIVITNEAETTELVKYAIPSSSVVTGNEGYNDETAAIAFQTFDFTTPADVTSVKLTLGSNGIDKLIRFDNLSITKKSATSIESQDEEVGIRVVDNQLLLGDDIISTAVFNLTGAAMSTVMENNMIDISDFPAGTYLLRAVTKSNKTISYKFIK